MRDSQHLPIGCNTIYAEAFSRKIWMTGNKKRSAIPPTNTTLRMNRNKEPILLKGKLRHGKISYKEGDFEMHVHRSGFEVPEYITQSLLEYHEDIAEAVVELVSDPKEEGVLRMMARYSIDGKIVH